MRKRIRLVLSIYPVPSRQERFAFSLAAELRNVFDAILMI